MIGTPQLLVDGLVFPEGPRWRDGRLWFVDMHAHRLHTVTLDGVLTTELEHDDQPSGLGFLPDGSLLVVSVRKRQLLRLDQGRVEPYADLTSIPGGHLNDMVVDERGRAFIGNRIGRRLIDGRFQATPHWAGIEEGIILVTPDRQACVVAEDLVGPNGTVVTADGRTLIVSESLGHQLTAYTINDAGSLSNRRVWAPLPGRFADGICLDAEGGIWFGSPLSHEFCRVVEGGEITDRLPLPEDTFGIAVALGGPDRKTLFLLKARTDLASIGRLHSFEDDLNSTAYGWIEVVDVDVPGAGLP